MRVTNNCASGPSPGMYISGFGNGNVTCWTCDEKKATHMEYRDALGEYEFTCDECHREEYPEQYEEEEEDTGLEADNTKKT